MSRSDDVSVRFFVACALLFVAGIVTGCWVVARTVATDCGAFGHAYLTSSVQITCQVHR